MNEFCVLVNITPGRSPEGEFLVSHRETMKLQGGLSAPDEIAEGDPVQPRDARLRAGRHLRVAAARARGDGYLPREDFRVSRGQRKQTIPLY